MGREQEVLYAKPSPCMMVDACHYSYFKMHIMFYPQSRSSWKLHVDFCEEDVSIDVGLSVVTSISLWKGMLAFRGAVLWRCALGNGKSLRLQVIVL